MPATPVLPHCYLITGSDRSYNENMTNTNIATASNTGTCADCGATKPLTARGLCRPCDEEIAFCPADAAAIIATRSAAFSADVEAPAALSAPVAELARDLTALGEQGAANAAVQGIGSMRTGELRGVGFSSKDGYITALRNGVKACTHASYLTTLRTQYGMTSADIAALNLPGPMVESALPVGPGIKHTPTGPSIFDLPKAQRQFTVAAPAPEQQETVRLLNRTDLIAGAVAEGHGVIICWRGAGRPERGQIVAALETLGRAGQAPVAKSARAQAGRAVEGLRGLGFDVRADLKSEGADLPAGSQRWTVGKVNHATAEIGTEYGKVILTVTLTDGVLSFAGDESLAAQVLANFNARTAGDVYQSSDVTEWLGRILRNEHMAIEYGLGWYVPAKHRLAAAALCEAISAVGFGSAWVGGKGRPALPVATSDQLRDGILRGLVEEVETLLSRLATERDAAKTARQAGDIGAKRAATFLGELREITKRIAAYGEMMGAERVAAAREQVRLAIVELEGVLGDDYTGIGARFALIADECAFDKPAPTAN